ncbi:MAG: hypothetical protein F6K31_43535 [Symploca sp. SIO2G7]|nr:hypothetical protein [Symploca sp. SIO2G7]
MTIALPSVLIGSLLLNSQREFSFDSTAVAQHTEKIKMVDRTHKDKDSQQNTASPVIPDTSNHRDLTIEEMQNAQPLPIPEVQDNNGDTSSEAEKSVDNR